MPWVVQGEFTVRWAIFLQGILSASSLPLSGGEEHGILTRSEWSGWTDCGIALRFVVSFAAGRVILLCGIPIIQSVEQILTERQLIFWKRAGSIRRWRVIPLCGITINRLAERICITGGRIYSRFGLSFAVGGWLRHSLFFRPLFPLSEIMQGD